MNSGGPQQFALQAYDSSFQTKDPSAPVVGVDIAATVGVTVNWDPERKSLTKDGVQYDPAEWQDPGCGPLALFDDAMGGQVKPVGTVTWSVFTKTLTQTESDAANQRSRVVITPTIQLFRQIVRTGAVVDNHSVYTASATVFGNWC